jgi:epoxyqueuosine reductase QueG
MEDDKPKWLHKCEHCVACISWCPVQGIQYGKRTKARRRYQNPEIKVDELFLK